MCGCHEKRGCYRAEVLGASDSEARLFAYDYGVVLTAPWAELFSPTRHMQLGLVPPQARLCRIAGKARVCTCTCDVVDSYNVMYVNLM